MRLHRRLVRKSKTGKPYYRWDLPLPSEAVEALGWSRETVLVWRARGGKLVVEPE